ncbi:MAG: hypothetical protein ACJATP_001006 [Candidatus Azotimanducaceae bacterium]|jgi:hypothetical protein
MLTVGVAKKMTKGMNVICWTGLCIALLFSSLTQAAVEASAMTYARIGEIHSTNPVDRTAIISGYRYSFNGVSGYGNPTIKMLGGFSGDYGMLQPGMKVLVVFRSSRWARIVESMEQVANHVAIGVPESQ